MYHPTLSSAVIRRIWGCPDAILLFFAGGAAEFGGINRIHRRVVESRGEEIPLWAYRDMLFILIDYGERAHEVVLARDGACTRRPPVMPTIWPALGRARERRRWVPLSSATPHRSTPIATTALPFASGWRSMVE
jgi:hypothetical protein